MITARWTTGTLLTLILTVWATGTRHIALVALFAVLFLVFCATFREASR